jgi:hypothetical protein
VLPDGRQFFIGTAHLPIASWNPIGVVRLFVRFLIVYHRFSFGLNIQCSAKNPVFMRL